LSEGVTLRVGDFNKEDKMAFVEVAGVSEIPRGTMKSFSAGIWQVLVANVDDRFYAINNYCSHEAASLSQGTLKGSTITCPLHGARFDVITGKCLAGPKAAFFREKGKDATVFEVKVEAGKILVNSS
jgi:3-phenylpropionate/trans-cinnamate dioxygenase ferredoxin subunit